jgi:hypothetical protein
MSVIGTKRTCRRRSVMSAFGGFSDSFCKNLIAAGTYARFCFPEMALGSTWEAADVWVVFSRGRTGCQFSARPVIIARCCSNAQCHPISALAIPTEARPTPISCGNASCRWNNRCYMRPSNAPSGRLAMFRGTRCIRSAPTQLRRGGFCNGMMMRRRRSSRWRSQQPLVRHSGSV